jgi:hypothetical protein
MLKFPFPEVAGKRVIIDPLPVIFLRVGCFPNQPPPPDDLAVTSGIRDCFGQLYDGLKIHFGGRGAVAGPGPEIWSKTSDHSLIIRVQINLIHLVFSKI